VCVVVVIQRLRLPTVVASKARDTLLQWTNDRDTLQRASDVVSV